MGCASGAAAGRRFCTSRRARGSPGCWARACCCRAKDTGGGGGGALAMTCRFAMAAGGEVTRISLVARPPNTLFPAGVTAAQAVILSDWMLLCFTSHLGLGYAFAMF